jgi:MarR family transcriptional regulator, 2-MHQ and catechol-resistance regulon repressor
MNEVPRLGLVLARYHRALSQIAERNIEESGLGLTDIAALEALLHKVPLTITEIHGKVPLEFGSMTAAVDRLEKKGLLIRTAANEDRWAKLPRACPRCSPFGRTFPRGRPPLSSIG